MDGMNNDYNQTEIGIENDSIDTAEEKHSTLERNGNEKLNEINSRQFENNETNAFIPAQNKKVKYTSTSEDIFYKAQCSNSSDNFLLSSGLNIGAGEKQFKRNGTSKDSLKFDYRSKSAVIGRNETILRTTEFISVINEHGLNVDSVVQSGSNEKYVTSIRGSQSTSFNKGKNTFLESSLVSIKNECLVAEDSSESSSNIVKSNEISRKIIDGPTSSDRGSRINITNDDMTESVMKTGHILESSNPVAGPSGIQPEIDNSLEGNMFVCPLCPERFARSYDFDIHYRTHWVKKLFVCDVCKKEFTRKGNLEIHYRTHTGKKPFVCEICKKKFTHKGNMNRHYRTHTGEKPFACELCNKKFTQKGNLWKHYRTHTGKKPFVCELCNKEFAEKGSMNRHYRTHTGEKPFVCELCNKEFTQKGDLGIHYRRHMGEKPFVCDVCGKSFTTLSELSRHARTHTVT